MGGLIMSVILNATTSNGMTMTPDNSGAVQFQSNGTNTIYIDTSGNFLVGTTSTLFGAKLSVVQPASQNVGIGTTSTSGQKFIVAGNSTFTGSIAGNGATGLINSGTAVATTSGTSITFTGIPSTAKRITVMFSGVSVSSTANPLLQVGSGSVQTTGYLCATSAYQSTSSGATVNYTTGFGVDSSSSSNVLHGSFVLTLISGNTWTMALSMATSNANVAFFGGGSVALSGVLDRVNITTVGGTNTFTAGLVNIFWE